MKSIEELIEGYRRFRGGVYSEQAALYRELGEGQSPAIMLIACADSRAEPSDIFSAAPGQLFVVRNVANLVPPYMPDGKLHGVSSALEYAVNVLKVQHIVVMGHGGCGGVQASLAGGDNPLIGEFVTPWVSLLDQARDRVLESGSINPQFSLELGRNRNLPQESDELPLRGKSRQCGRAGAAWRVVCDQAWRTALAERETGRFEVVDR
jgi:carbonic anhydrase